MYKFICISVLLHHSASILAHNQVVTEPLPVSPCIYDYSPVCGSDGITYYNDCVLKYTSSRSIQDNLGPIHKVKDGECSDCICQKVNIPVCTLDDLTFPNECELGCENLKRIRAKQPILKLAYRAGCIGPSTGCTDLAAPVCGNDNIQYRNKCVLDTANAISLKRGGPTIKLKNYGVCLESCLCPLEHQPVCGSNGNIYENACYLTCQNRLNYNSKYPFVNIVDRTLCGHCHCGPINNPVCGSDGRNYNNPCELNCEAKRQGTHITVHSYSKCSGCYCSDELAPVCGTDRETYTNECQLKCANNKRVDGYSISVLHQGECQPAGCNCNNICPPEYQPICGTDNRTYWNLCWLNCNADCTERNRNTVHTLFVQKSGSCYV